MTQTLVITFLEPAPVNGYLGLSYYPNFPDTSTTAVRGETFKTLRAFSGQTTIGADTSIQADNYRDAFELDFNLPTAKFDVDVTGNVVTITALNGSPIFGENVSSGFAVFSYVNDVAPVVLARSTFSVRVIPNTPFDRCELSLFTWSGASGAVPVLPRYPLSKSVVQLNDQVISFDINNLIKENINNRINGYDLPGVQPTLTDASTWVRYEAIAYNDDEEVYTDQKTLIAIYGFGYFHELYNPVLPSKVLITGDRHVIYRNEDYRVYFVSEGLVSIEVNTADVPFDLDPLFNSEYFASINLKEYTDEDAIEVVFTYEDDIVRTLNFEVKDECKYPVINCVFINKYGFPQSFFFNKLSKFSDDVDSEDYRGNTPSFGVYSSVEHQYNTFNLNGRGKTVVNTDLLDQSANETIKELVHSEKIWHIQDGVISPVTLDTKSIEYKTRFDKQVQYTMTFKNAFDTINQL